MRKNRQALQNENGVTVTMEIYSSQKFLFWKQARAHDDATFIGKMAS